MATKCFTPVLGRRLRLTRVDGCGRPIYGAGSQAVSKGFIQVTYSAEIAEGEEIEQTNAAGERCVYLKVPDSIKYIQAEIQFCEVDPGLVGLINPANALELDANGDIVGWRESVEPSDSGGFALEVWTDVQGESACDDPNATGAWGYILCPWLTSGVMGDLEIGAASVNFTFTANAQAGSRWGVGPHKVVANAAGAPSPLAAPIGTKEVRLIRQTTIAPPPATCGTTDLPAPGGATLTATVDGTDPMKFTFKWDGTAEDGTVVNFAFGDGTTGTATVTDNAAEAEHTYTQAGTKIATATAQGETVAAYANPSQP
ncbi:hypothetical protein [Streptomyces sp. cg35]|uniref:hypothetical protein n=1 Tax=Streptomyces sp. cg35 TaxID=3421650 RepID=UPI003D16CF4D